MKMALFFLLREYSGGDHVNLASGGEETIRELAETIA